jgi:hypothetical protein
VELFGFQKILLEPHIATTRIWSELVSVWFTEEKAIFIEYLEITNRNILGEISGSHSDEYDDGCLLGFCTMWSG